MKQSLSAIKVIENAAKEIPGVISLAQGVPSIYSDEYIRQAVIRAIQENKVDKYSSGSGIEELRLLIAEKLQQRGVTYSAEEEIIVTAGAIEALSATLLGLLNEGDEVVVFPPTYYANYKNIVEMAGGVVVNVPLQEENDWSLNLHQLQLAMNRRTKAIILCNPNNPTGTIFSKEELLEIGELAKKNGTILIFDDVYHHLVYEKELFYLMNVEEYRDNIIRIVSLSKDFALTGWRIGFLHGPKHLIERIIPMHDNLINCAPVISQYAALAALQHEQEIVPRVVQEYRERRDIMKKGLEEMKDYLDFVVPDGAYYFFPKIHGVEETKEFAMDILRNAKVGVVPGEDFGPGGKGHVRLCFGRSKEDITEALSRLKIYFEKKG